MAWMVEVGFTPPPVTKTEPSMTKRLRTSWLRPHSLTTEVAGLVPMRQVPSRWVVEDFARDGGGVGAGFAHEFGGTGDTVLHHGGGVGADGVVDARGGDAVAVLQVRIERDAVVFFRQVIAGNADMGAAVVVAAHGGVVAFAPGHAAGFEAGLGFTHRARAAAKLQHVAAGEAAGEVGFVELLGPERDDGAALAVHLFMEPALHDGPGVEHQVAADEIGGVCETVGEAFGF